MYYAYLRDNLLEALSKRLPSEERLSAPLKGAEYNVANNVANLVKKRNKNKENTGYSLEPKLAKEVEEFIKDYRPGALLVLPEELDAGSVYNNIQFKKWILANVPENKIVVLKNLGKPGIVMT